MRIDIKRMWKQLSVAKKASLALIFARVCQKGLAMLSTPIFTRIMTTEQYGDISNFTSWQSTIFIVATLNLAMGVFNNGMLDFKADRNSFMLSSLALSNISTIIIGILVLLLYPLIKGYFGLSDGLIFLMFIYMFFYPAFQYWSTRQRYEYKYKLLTLWTIIIAFLQVILGIVAVIFSVPDYQAVNKLYVSEGVIIAAGMVSYIVIALRAKGQIKKEYISYAFKFNIFLVPHFLAMTILSSGDRIMITNMVGKRETAIYSVSYTVASVVLIFWEAVEASWIPWLYEHLSTGVLVPIKKRANEIVVLFGGITLVCMLFAPEAVAILASSDYYEGVFIIPSVTAGVFFQALYAMYMRLEYFSKETKATMVCSITAAVINILLNYVFIKLFGYIAAGYTTLFCYILLFLFHMLYCSRIGMKNIYNNRFIIIASVVMVILSIVVLVLYQMPIIRYLCICGFLIIALIKRKKIILLVKK